MSIEHWIMVYLFLNGVLCYQLDGDSWSERSWRDWAEGSIAALLGIPIMIAIALRFPAEWLDKRTQIGTFLRYVFYRRSLVFPPDSIKFLLEASGDVSKQPFLYRLALRLILKVNNYTPEK